MLQSLRVRADKVFLFTLGCDTDNKRAFVSRAVEITRAVVSSFNLENDY